MRWISVIVFGMVSVAMPADTDIRLNSLGFLPNSPKKGTIVAKAGEFSVKVAAEDKTVFSGTAAGPVHQQDVGQDTWTADFSGVKAAGRYYLDVPGVGRSYEFEIGPRVYDAALVTAMRAFICGGAGQPSMGRTMGFGLLTGHAICTMPFRIIRVSARIGRMAPEDGTMRATTGNM